MSRYINADDILDDEYESPIKITRDKMEVEYDGAIWKAVQSVNIRVDRDELIKALQYDRNQYEKGYEDGRRDARRHGHWESYCPWDQVIDYDNFICSVCDNITDSKTPYCPSCGAKMDEEVER